MALMALGIDLMLPAFDDIRVAFDLGAGPRADSEPGVQRPAETLQESRLGVGVWCLRGMFWRWARAMTAHLPSGRSLTVHPPSRAGLACQTDQVSALAKSSLS